MSHFDAAGASKMLSDRASGAAVLIAVVDSRRRVGWKAVLQEAKSSHGDGALVPRVASRTGPTPADFDRWTNDLQVASARVGWCRCVIHGCSRHVVDSVWATGRGPMIPAKGDFWTDLTKAIKAIETKEKGGKTS